MILAVCLNCSLDTRYTVPGFRAGAIHSVPPPSVTAGGKGLNLARVAAQLGAEVTALGLVGERELDFFTAAMAAQGVQPRFTPVPVPSRRCLNIVDPRGDAPTEILEQGWPVTAEYLVAVLGLAEELAPQASVICASGSVPPGLPADAYARLGKLARKFGRPFILDARGEHLRQGLRGLPFAVKPNRAELEAWAGTPLQTELDIAAALCRLVREGTELAVVSLGAEGAMAVGQGRLWRVRPPRVQAVNTVGSGDAFAAGLAVGLERNLPLAEVLALACACGTANALHPETGHVDRKALADLLPRIEISTKEVSR